MSIEAKFHIDRGNFTLDVDRKVPSRGVISLLGPSGSGKTTLLRAIAGLEYHKGGYLKVDDMIWQDAKHFIPPHKRALGYVFQESSLFAHLTVRRNLEYGIKRVPKIKRKVSLPHAIELLEIGHLLERKPDKLSGGERQRVAIARALAVSPQLLLMDEPLAALEPERKNEILPYLESLHNELDIPVIYVSHSPDEVARLADHLILLEDGSIVAEGSIYEMFTRLDLSLAHSKDAEAIIEAVVAKHDTNYDLTYLDFSGGLITVVHQDLPINNLVRLRIAARDVSLTLKRQSDTSILNIFPAKVEEITTEGPAQMTVRLMVGKVSMLARVTRKSATTLDLQPGKKVFAQVKSIALLT